VRKISELSGRFRLVTPVVQLAVPWPSADRVLITQVLVCGLDVLGIGRGAPKKQPVLVQLRSLPVSCAVVGPRVRAWFTHAVTFVKLVLWFGMVAGSGTLLLPPPK